MPAVHFWDFTGQNLLRERLSDGIARADTFSTICPTEPQNLALVLIDEQTTTIIGDL